MGSIYCMHCGIETFDHYTNCPKCKGLISLDPIPVKIKKPSRLLWFAAGALAVCGLLGALYYSKIIGPKTEENTELISAADKAAPEDKPEPILAKIEVESNDNTLGKDEEVIAYIKNVEAAAIDNNNKYRALLKKYNSLESDNRKTDKLLAGAKEETEYYKKELQRVKNQKTSSAYKPNASPNTGQKSDQKIKNDIKRQQQVVDGINMELSKVKLEMKEKGPNNIYYKTLKNKREVLMKKLEYEDIKLRSLVNRLGE